MRTLQYFSISREFTFGIGSVFPNSLAAKRIWKRAALYFGSKRPLRKKYSSLYSASAAV